MKIVKVQIEEPDIQMAPLIDMVFLLLIFFICASHLNQTEKIPIEVPVAARTWAKNSGERSVWHSASRFSSDQAGITSR